MLCTELITQNHKCSWQTTPVISRELKNTLNKIGKKCKKNVTNSLKNSQLNSFLEKYLRIKQIWEYLFCSTFLWGQPRLRIWRVENILRLEKILRLEYIFYGCGPRSDNTAKVKVEFPTKWPCILTRPVLHIFIPRWQFIVRICLSIPYIAKFLPRHLTIEWSKGPLLLQGPKGFLLGTLGPAASLWLHDLWPWLDPSVHTSAPIFKIMKVLAFIRFNVST